MPLLFNPLTGEFNISASGSGGVSGPASSTTNSVAIFSDTTGKALAEGAMPIILEQGQFNSTSLATNIPSIKFTGTNTGTGVGGSTSIAANTGFDAITCAAGTYLEFYAEGYFLMDAGIGNTNRGLLTIEMDVIPGNGSNHYTMGTTTDPWYQMYSQNAFVMNGGQATRSVYVMPGGYGGNIVGYGIDMTDNYGSAYFRCYDLTLGTICDNVYSFKPDNRVITQILGAAGTGVTAGYSGKIAGAAAVDAKAGNLTLKGGDASGSGAGGDVLLSRSTSATGQAGDVFMPSVAGAPADTPNSNSGFVPFRYDTTNNKLWIYNGAWKGVVLA